MPSTNAATNVSTYVVGEDHGRLERTAQQLGVMESRTARTWRNLMDSTFTTAARMHSVGVFRRG